MWYLVWVLGVTMAVLLAVVNAMWYEAKVCAATTGHDHGLPSSNRTGEGQDDAQG